MDKERLTDNEAGVGRLIRRAFLGADVAGATALAGGRLEEIALSYRVDPSLPLQTVCRGAPAPQVVVGGTSAPCACARSALDELEQVGVELVLVRERKAVRRARVDLEFGVGDDLRGQRGRVGERDDLVVVAVDDQRRTASGPRSGRSRDERERGPSVGLGNDVRSRQCVGDECRGFRSCLLDVDRRRLGRGLVQGFGSPEAAEAQDYRLSGKPAR